MFKQREEAGEEEEPESLHGVFDVSLVCLSHRRWQAASDLSSPALTQSKSVWSAIEDNLPPALQVQAQDA